MSTLHEVAQALREAAVMRVCVMRAFAPGDVVLLETERSLSKEQAVRLGEQLRAFIDLPVQIIVLPPGVRVAGREEHERGAA